MIERVSPISRATAAVLPGIVGRLAPEAIVPVILLATKQEARGALMRVGGLRVIDRTLRQMARLRDVRVTIVSDGSIRQRISDLVHEEHSLRDKLSTHEISAAEEHARLFGELIALESYRRGLRERAIGGV